MLFGETIAWMRPNSPLFKPEPEPEPEPEPAPVGPAAAAPAVLDQFALPSDGDGGPGDGPKNRTRLLLMVAGVLAVVLIGVVGFAVLGGGGDDAKVATGAPATTTTVAPTTTTVAQTIPPSQGEEKQTAAGTQVTVKSDVLFDVNSSDLTPDANSRLGAFLTLAARDKKRHLIVEGFTDSDGDPGFNQQLSEARAQSVATWLIGQGIDPARISAVGHGADQAVAPNDTPENKALNRRVVVTLQNATP
jgi:outer membrane protein OmpA-like peptidoglycan-associated protein